MHSQSVVAWCNRPHTIPHPSYFISLFSRWGCRKFRDWLKQPPNFSRLGNMLQSCLIFTGAARVSIVRGIRGPYNRRNRKSARTRCNLWPTHGPVFIDSFLGRWFRYACNCRHICIESSDMEWRCAANRSNLAGGQQKLMGWIDSCLYDTGRRTK